MKRTPLKRKTPLRSRPKEPVYRVPTDRHPPFDAGQLKRQQSMQRKPKLARKPMPKQSPMMKVRNAEYVKAKTKWREQHDGRCEVRFTDASRTNHAPRGEDHFRCRRATVDLHHMKGRSGANLTDASTFLGVCRLCHNFFHSHANEARRLGYLIRPTPL